MKIETRNNGINDYMAVIADEGKTLRRIEDGWMPGNEVSLGYSHYHLVEDVMVKRDEPLLELPEHYEEVEIPQDVEEEQNDNEHREL